MEINGITLLIFVLFLILEYILTSKKGFLMSLVFPFLIVILTSMVFGYQFSDLSSSPWMSYVGVFIILYGFYVLIRRLNKRKRQSNDK